jgi:DNA-binding MarR family transcriptional regulator
MELERQVSVWVDAILHNGEQEYSFDSIYSSVFQSILASQSDRYKSALCAGFQASIEQFQEEILSQPPDSFNYELQSLCSSVAESVKKLAAAFFPLTFVEPSLDLSAMMLEIFKNVIFGSHNELGRMDSFLVSFAHSLIGSHDIEPQKMMIDLLLNFLQGTPKWVFFVEHMAEATDAYCLHVTASVLRDEAVQANPLVYLGVVYEVLENEERLWALFPKNVGLRLRDVLLTGLILSVKDQFLFHERYHALIGDVLFGDATNHYAVVELLQRVFTQEEVREDLMSLVGSYFGQAVNALATECGDKVKSIMGSCRIVEGLIDIFGKIRLLAKSPLGLSPVRREAFRQLRETLLADPRLRIERAMTNFIGRAVEGICNDRQTEAAHRLQIRRCRRMVYAMPDRWKFVRKHSHAMNIRLFQLAGQQYKIEELVIRELESFLPPTIGQTFSEKVQEYARSEGINAKWNRAYPESPLSVLVLSADRSAGIVTRFERLRIPPSFGQLQDQFVAFYRQQFNGANIGLKWIYEDNMVLMHLVKDGKYNFMLKMPLVFAAVLNIVYQLGAPRINEIADAVSMSVGQVDYLVKRAVGRDFALLKIVPNPDKAQVEVSFNPAFEMKKRRLAVVVQQKFSLSPPPKAGATQAAVPAAQAAAPAGPDVGPMYTAQIMRLMKNSRQLDANRLAQLTERETMKVVGKFSKAEYDKAFTYLEQQGFIQRDPVRQSVIAYVVAPRE